MREKYESLNLSVLKELAKARGIKGLSVAKKAVVVEAMLKQDEIDAANEAAAKRAAASGAGGSASGEAPAPKRRGRPRKNPQPEESVQAAPESTDSDAAGTSAQAAPTEIKPANRRPGRPAKHAQAYRTAPETQEKTIYRPQPQAHPVDPERRTYTKRKEYFDENGNRVEEIEERELPHYDDEKDCYGILEIMTEGYGFIRCENYMPGENDVYVSPSQIRKFNLKTGDVITGKTRKNNPNDKFGALMFMSDVNGYNPDDITKRPDFEELTPIFPNERIRLEYPNCSVAMRIVDLISPIGKGQRGMIVSQPKAGKTTLLKQIAKSVLIGDPKMHLIILLIDERPEEVTDIKEAITGDNVEVIYSTFDEKPEHHKRVSEMAIERARRLVEHGNDVMILLDSITRLARAYNLTVQPSGRTLSGGLDPAALHMPKRFFGAARNMREGGSLTILATALVETGSKMDDVVFEEFKGTGNMELVLDRKLSEKRVFPAIDLARSSTRREDLLFDKEEMDAMDIVRKALNGMKKEEAGENILNMFTHTKTNIDFIRMVLSKRII